MICCERVDIDTLELIVDADYGGQSSNVGGKQISHRNGAMEFGRGGKQLAQWRSNDLHRGSVRVLMWMRSALDALYQIVLDDEKKILQ